MEASKKICKNCKMLKSLNMFYSRSSKCKECLKEYRENNKEKIKDYSKQYRKNNYEKITINRWISYGVKCNDFKSLYDTFKEATYCYLCNVEFDNTDKDKRKCLDHDHFSGYPRFICCDTCNKKLRKVDNRRMKVLLDLHRYFNIKNES